MTVDQDAGALTSESTSRTSSGPDVLHYHEAGDGTPLVLLHGAGPGVSAWSNFGKNIPVLAEHFRTLAVDQPGYGTSYRPELNRPYYTIAADAVVRLLDELQLDRVDVLGNSMGAGVGARMALDHPDRVRRLVLMGAAGLGVNVLQTLPSEGLKRLRGFAANPSRETLIEWLKTMVANESTITEELIETRLANALAPGQMDWMKAYMAAMGAAAPAVNQDPVPMWAQSSKITAPTLIVCGRDDRMIPLELNLLPARQMPNVELHVFSACGHWTQVERKSDFERLVIEFLTR
jgi:4,5:9,10-diseco-3-hydroxy-5,9,17-trioxoandrosta-1(10),2-diene-4-oate hydrolase